MVEKQLVKSETGELVSVSEQALTLADTMQLGAVLAESGMFPGIASKAQAVAKILLGKELGLPPVTSLQQIFLVQGRLMLSGQLIAGLINRSGRYRYEVAAHTETECKIQFFKDEQPAYLSAFTMQDAKRAGIDRADSGWAKYPRAMLFNRAISQGAKIVCPELLGGTETLEDAGYEEVEGQVVKEGEPPASSWRSFWSEAKVKGYSEDKCHEILGMASVKDWLAKGKSLEQALEVLRSAKAKDDIDKLFSPEPDHEKNMGKGYNEATQGSRTGPQGGKGPEPQAVHEKPPESPPGAPTQEELAKAKATVDLMLPTFKPWPAGIPEFCRWLMDQNISTVAVLRHAGKENWREFRSYAEAWEVAKAVGEAK